MRQRGGPQQGLEAEKAERRRLRLITLNDAFEQLQQLLHQLEGTSGGSYGTREMAIAGTHVETAWLWAREALEE